MPNDLQLWAPFLHFTIEGDAFIAQAWRAAWDSAGHFIGQGGGVSKDITVSTGRGGTTGGGAIPTNGLRLSSGWSESQAQRMLGPKGTKGHSADPDLLECNTRPRAPGNMLENTLRVSSGPA